MPLADSPPDWVQESVRRDSTAEINDSFKQILNAQRKALELMDVNRKTDKSFPFSMKEMVTDIAVSKSGLMGLSALKANTGVEITWRKMSGQNPLTEESAVDYIVEADVSKNDLNSIVDSIMRVVRITGKIRKGHKIRKNILEALEAIDQLTRSMEVTSYNRWQARSLRLDLNFSADGTVWFITKAGIALRLRMEWKLKVLPLTDSKMALINKQTKFVVKTLAELNEALDQVSVQGFEPKEVMIGVGSDEKKVLFGLWKYRSGFIGWLGFVPVKVTPLMSVSIPSELMNEDFALGGLEDEGTGTNSGLFPWGKKSIARKSFSSGLLKSVQTAAFLAERAETVQRGDWQIDEVKTVNDISRTGFFGLSSATTRGIVEIDFKRK